MFTVMCVYYTILWSRFPTAHNILKLAVSIALGMLTKQSVAQMAFPIAAVMLWMLGRSLDNGRDWWGMQGREHPKCRNSRRPGKEAAR